ncbi:glucosamine inositolphosphorylceramide transferase family protein [Rosenbergiella collisarenosi]|uniref:glucosamine inositolphosphorylceramide transferase family protein n=1 Tax=Rosenbergiella collisarenosi TaxID=1544695 RepID=UPI001F4D8840|nr:hypothetical protein [Rosenbergiella collisarenosi]
MDILNTEIWRVGIIRAPIQDVLKAGTLETFPITWVEADDSLCFIADPFGLWQGGLLYLFVEAYDYRTRRGYIVAYVLDAELNILEHRPVLREEWHLSYPVVFEADGEIWMLPEAYKSGRLTLYRAIEFPWRWQAVPEFQFPEAAIDASPLFHAGRWWMFYTPPTPKAARTNTLKLASADHLFGPWDQQPIQTLREDIHGSRMGGTPFLANGKIFLPTQDCHETYGGALQLLSFPEEGISQPDLSCSHRLTAPHHNAPYLQGLHTLSQAGSVTLVDTKRELCGSPRRILIELSRLWHKK